MQYTLNVPLPSQSQNLFISNWSEVFVTRLPMFSLERPLRFFGPCTLILFPWPSPSETSPDTFDDGGSPGHRPTTTSRPGCQPFCSTRVSWSLSCRPWTTRPDTDNGSDRSRFLLLKKWRFRTCSKRKPTEMESW